MINNADTFSQPSLIIFTKGANIFAHNCTYIYILGVAQINQLVDFSALPWRFKLNVNSRWSYRGRNRIRNPHLRSVSKQFKLQINSYSESAPQDMCDYITECSKLNGRMHV